MIIILCAQTNKIAMEEKKDSNEPKNRFSDLLKKARQIQSISDNRSFLNIEDGECTDDKFIEELFSVVTELESIPKKSRSRVACTNKLK